MNRRRGFVYVTLAAIAAAIFAAWPRGEATSHYFEITLRASRPGMVRFYPDINASLDDANCQRGELTQANVEQTLRFALKDGRYLNFRLSPTDASAATVTLNAARIVSRAGVRVRTIAPEQIERSANSVVTIELGSPLILKTYANPSRGTVLRRFVVAWLIAVVAVLVATSLGRVPLSAVGRAMKNCAAWLSARPARLILATAAGAVVLSCYPVLCFGRSFLAPNNNSHSCLLYAEMPTVPASTEARVDTMIGTDFGAAMWYSWPTSIVESRALFHDFELPLWNRYDAAGVPLLGQGQSMLGDPLHLLALLSGGSPFWWDLKYVLAKFIFAAALGFCVWRLTTHLPSAVFVAATSAFLGFFGYRYSHPAFFSLCYAPSVLLCWLKLLQSPTRRSAVAWSGLMVLANWTLLNSGTVKEAYILLLAMNACGLLTLLVARGVDRKVKKVWRGLLSFALFTLIATPVWLTFLETLGKSWTVYDVGAVFQQRPSLLVGLFDDIFYRQLSSSAPRVLPSANFMILVAVLWFCVSRSKIERRNLSLGPAVTCVVALAFAFGIVPAAAVSQLPFINRIYHIDNTFSCVAIVCLLILAGFGVKAFCRDLETAEFHRSYVAVLVVLAGLLVSYFWAAGCGFVGAASAFVWIYCAMIFAAAAIVPLVGALFLRNTRWRFWAGLSLAAIFVVATWRHGMHLDAPFRPDVMNPQSRTDLFAQSSAALRLIRERSPTEPFRSVGLKYNLCPGYGGAIAIEQIDGPDPLLNRHYKSLMDAADIPLLFAAAREGELDEPLAVHAPLLNMLNVRYVLGSGGGKLKLAPSLSKIAALDLDVYESSEVWPRAFFTNQLVSYGSEGDFIALLRRGSQGPFAAMAQTDVDGQKALRQWSRSASLSPRQIAPATDYALTTNKTSFKIRAPGAGVVVLTEPYIQDDFQLRVNGRPSDYFRVNSAFRGVFVPSAGDYEISFAYWPRQFTMSLWISALAFGLLLLWLGISARRTDNEQAMIWVDSH